MGGNAIMGDKHPKNPKTLNKNKMVHQRKPPGGEGLGFGLGFGGRVLGLGVRAAADSLPQEVFFGEPSRRVNIIGLPIV